MASKVDELRERLELLERVIAQHGILLPAEEVEPTERPDYIPHGSARHAALLGLVDRAGDPANQQFLAEFTSAKTGTTYRLEDEVDALRHYPGVDPAKACLLVLQQKVNELETAPTVPADAPPMFRPDPVY
jgi:hypothetical protein